MSSSTTLATKELLQDLLAQRVLVLDGAMGTLLMARCPNEADYRQERFADHPIDLKNSNDMLVLTQPEVVADARVQEQILRLEREEVEARAALREDLAAR